METIENIELAYLNANDYQALKDLMQVAYPDKKDLHWKKHEIEKLVSLFPEGQVVLKVNGELAGCALAVLQDDDITERAHTYN